VLPRRLWSGGRNFRTLVVRSDGPQGFLDCLWVEFCLKRNTSVTKVYYDRGLHHQRLRQHSQIALFEQSKPIMYLSKGLGLPHAEVTDQVAGQACKGYMWNTKSLKPLVWTEEDLSMADFVLY